MSPSGKDGQTFVLLRYVLIIAAAYLFLFEGETPVPAVLVILIAGALLSNVLVGHLLKNLLSHGVTAGLIISIDVIWIAAGLWYKGGVGSDIFFLYCFVLILAAVAGNILLIVGASVLLSVVDLVLFVAPLGEGKSIWMSPSLIRVPFMFVVALFYGFLVERVKEEKKIAEKRIYALQEIDLAITSTLDLHAVLEILLEKIDLFLPYAVATVRLLNKTTGELEPAACRNLDEQEWKAATAGAGAFATMIPENNAPVMVRNGQADPQSLSPEFLRKNGLVSYLRVPLIAKGVLLGVLTFFTKEEHEFSAEEVKFLSTLASRAAIAIHNSQLYEETVKAQKVKDEFLSIMSHELRTPLTAITGYAGLLAENMLGEIERSRALQRIINSSNDLLAMINNILFVTSVDALTVKVESRNVDLANFLSELKSSYDGALYKDIALRWESDSSLPAVKTDSAKLRHILENIINNAIKFTHKGQVTISARYLPAAHSVEFKVTDTGIGIPDEALPNIFEKFRQVDSSENRRHGGVGIGLYLVKKFTEMLGGKIDVQSELGKGSVFSVTLPCENYKACINDQDP